MNPRHPILWCLISLSSHVFSQGIEISPMINYHFGGKWNIREGDLKVNSSESYGASLTVSLLNSLDIETFWLRQHSELRFTDNFGFSENRLDVTIEYFNMGVVQYVNLNTLRPFVSLGFGVVVFTPGSNEITTETRMSANLTGGLKYYISDRVGIRIQTQMLLPVQWGSAGIFCSSGGCSGAVGGTTTVVQGTVGGGVILAFGN